MLVEAALIKNSANQKRAIELQKKHTFNFSSKLASFSGISQRWKKLFWWDFQERFYTKSYVLYKKNEEKRAKTRRVILIFL